MWCVNHYGHHCKLWFMEKIYAMNHWLLLFLSYMARRHHQIKMHTVGQNMKKGVKYFWMEVAVWVQKTCSSITHLTKYFPIFWLSVKRSVYNAYTFWPALQSQYILKNLTKGAFSGNRLNQTLKSTGGFGFFSLNRESLQQRYFAEFK